MGALHLKWKELAAMKIEELKKQLMKKGKDPVGKKDDMANALFEIHAQEEAAAAKKAQLELLDVDELKKMILKRGLRIGIKNKMVEAIIAHDTKVHEAVQMHDAKVQEILAQKKHELEEKTGNELKDLCISKGLPQGMTKEGRIQHLLEDLKSSGDADKMVVMMKRDARAAELHAMEMDQLQEFLAERDVDPLVKEVMVERLLAHESEHGKFSMAEVRDAPAAKKARISMMA